MTTQYDCSLSNVLLSSLDASICILDIREDAPEMHLSAASAPGGGQHLMARERTSLTVHVIFAIQEEIVSRRNAVLRTVRAWAEKGGVFTSTDRPGLQLQVVCSSMPGVSAKDWTAPLTLSFTTTRCPYWEDKDVVSVSANGTVTLKAPGTVDYVPVDAVITNSTPETLTQLTVCCGSTQMIFNDISLPPNNMLMILYSNHTLLAMINGMSVLPCRTPASSDLLLAPCGKGTTAYATSGQTLQATFSVRGRYL